MGEEKARRGMRRERECIVGREDGGSQRRDFWDTFD